jgi:6-phosphogluconolactonase
MPVIHAGPDLVSIAIDNIKMSLRGRLLEQSRVSIALSGGRNVGSILRALSQASIEWNRVDIYQVDERVVPLGDPARNLTKLAKELLDLVPATMYAMPVDEPDMEAAADRYALLLPMAVDVVHLGLGKDGHTASLVPDDPVLSIADRPVAVTRPYKGRHRMTLTFPALDRARSIVWIVDGAHKAPMVERLLAADQTIPAGRVCQERATLITNSLITGETP